MTNTMIDLREECAERLRETLHGREVDTLENTVKMPHMLGITPIGGVHSHKVEDGTIMDPDHEFWQEFEEDIKTRGGVHRKIESAINSLAKDGIFRKTYPYGEEADIIYCEIDKMEESGDVIMPTRCAECDESIDAPLSLECANNGSYFLNVDLHCPHCGCSRKLERSLQRR